MAALLACRVAVASPSEESAMNTTTAATTAATAATSAAAQNQSIRPFKFQATQEQLDDLRRRIKATKWPDKETVDDQSQGVQLATLRKLADYWGNEYDWRPFEARLQALPQFVTNIDGVDIHFIHVRSKHAGALPLIVTHGWPGSIVEQMKIIGPLTDPTAHGGKASDAFDVVIPSLPGYGFSGKPTETGWDPIRIARAWVVLMKRLGYNRFVAQGGDWGNAVTEQMALLKAPELIGIHTNMPATVPADIETALQAEMAGRPQTLYAIEDSPVGLAAWMLDHDATSLALITRVFDGKPEGLSRDDVLDNVTLYWLSNTAVSSARLYWESKLAFFAPKGVSIPVGVSAFPDELYQAPRSWTERAYPKLIHYNRLAKGGHFAAWEQPTVFVDELRATFRPLR